MKIVWLRVLIGLLVAAVIGVATVPLLILLDLSSSGDGYGLCPRGLDGCRTPFTAGPELITILVLLLFALLALLRITIRLIRRRARQDVLAQQALQKSAAGTGMVRDVRPPTQ